LSRARPIQVLKDEPPDLEARIITAIGQAGPRNVAQISRMTGAHQETIRYKIKKRFGRLGFRFHAEVDFAKLGLSPHWATLNFAKPYESVATQILQTLNEVGYLTYYARIVPQGNFAALFALPQSKADEYAGFLSNLTAKGILTSSTLDAVQADRHKVMDPHFFNFRSGRWEIEWDKVPAQAAHPLGLGGKSKVEDFDYYDLLVIKELQKDSLQHLTGIARKLKVHQKTLEYHYRTHVQKWKLIPSYRIRWVQDTTKRLVHSVATTMLTFHDLSNSEYIALQAATSKIPFLWSEHLLANGRYLAVLNVPVTDMISATTYINDAVTNLGPKAEVGFVKPSEAYSFTIPYNMYQDGRWKFDAGRMETALRKGSSVALKK
jgi:DNA-binding Lrp family transcriptional regulator